MSLRLAACTICKFSGLVGMYKKVSVCWVVRKFLPSTWVTLVRTEPNISVYRIPGFLQLFKVALKYLLYSFNFELIANSTKLVF